MKKAQTTAREPGLWDRLVNEKFAGQQPVLPGPESLKAARLLYRRAFGHAFDGEVRLTSGNRYTWVRRGVMSVNPDKRELHTRGLRSLIHDLSHYAHARLHPRDDPHSARQAYLERDLVDFAIARGFLEGKLAPRERAAPVEAPAPAKPDKVQQRYNRMRNRRDKYRQEVERLNRLLAKAEREVRDYERRHGDRLIRETGK